MASTLQYTTAIGGKCLRGGMMAELDSWHDGKVIGEKATVGIHRAASDKLVSSCDQCGYYGSATLSHKAIEAAEDHIRQEHAHKREGE